MRLEKRVDNLKGHFASAEKDIRDIETSAAKIARKGERIKEVELEDPAHLSPPTKAPAQSTQQKIAGQPDLLAGD